MEFEEWKSKVETAEREGLPESIAKHSLALFEQNDESRARSLLFLSTLHGSHGDDESSLLAALLSYLLDQDPRTLFLVATRAYAKHQFALVALLCDYYLAKHSESEPLIKLIKASSLLGLGKTEEAKKLASSIPVGTSMWLGKSMVSAEQIVQFNN